MFRRGKETLSIAMAKQVKASRGNGIEKRRRDLQRHCIATLDMAKAKHGPAWKCQGTGQRSFAMTMHGIAQMRVGIAQLG